jgi:hypothetical protein
MGKDVAMADIGAALPGVNVRQPNIARAYDYLLGGKDHFAADRMLAERILEIAPGVREGTRACRAFLYRVVRYLTADAGVTQFLDIGSGLPTTTNVHQVAHQVNPAARVVYVDNDPMVVAHGQALLADEVTTTVVEADLRQPERILNDPVTREFLDFTQPVAVLMMSVLHHVGDREDPGRIVEALRDAIPSGSYLAILHFWDPGGEYPSVSARAKASEKVLAETIRTGHARTREQIRAFFGDFEMVDPGLVPVAEWRSPPDETGENKVGHYAGLGGVGRKRR